MIVFVFFRIRMFYIYKKREPAVCNGKGSLKLFMVKYASDFLLFSFDQSYFMVVMNCWNCSINRNYESNLFVS